MSAVARLVRRSSQSEGGRAKAEGWATQEAATPDARCCGRVCAVGTARRAALTGPGGLPYKPPTFKTRRPRKLGILLVSRGRGALAAGSTGAPPGTSGEQTREADLPTEQIGAQAPPRLPEPHGDQGRPQGAQRPPDARPEAPQRLTAGQVGRSRGKITEAGGLSRRRDGSPSPWGGVRVADRRARGQWPTAGRVHGFEEGRQCGRAQSGAAAVAGNRAAFGRGTAQAGERLCVDWPARRARPSFRAVDRGFRSRARAHSSTTARAASAQRASRGRLEHDPEKRVPVFGNVMLQK